MWFTRIALVWGSTLPNAAYEKWRRRKISGEQRTTAAEQTCDSQYFGVRDIFRAASATDRAIQAERTRARELCHHWGALTQGTKAAQHDKLVVASSSGTVLRRL
jgi:hypothetical protein